MPYYNVAIFGVRGPKAILKTAQALGITLLNEDAEEDEATITTVDGVTEALENMALEAVTPEDVQARFDAVFAQIIGGMDGYTYHGAGKGQFGDCHKVDTPFGPRESLGLFVDVAFDNGECNDGIEDAVFGFWLTARYKPSILDLHDPHGGIKRMNAAQLAYVESLLRAHFPALLTAETHVHQRFA